MCRATADLQVTLPEDATASGISRAFLKAASCPVHHAVVPDEALLLVSELVTNAVEYGSPPIMLKVTCNGSEGLEVRVSDGSDRLPERGEPDLLAEGGRGLFLVDRLSERWGVDATDAGKEVWFALRPG
jgi:anti-sigma regulatory factor (Ser/Thr protein kinase)